MADLKKKKLGKGLGALLSGNSAAFQPAAAPAAVGPDAPAAAAAPAALADGSMLIATRFGDVNQIHRVAVPGGAGAVPVAHGDVSLGGERMSRQAVLVVVDLHLGVGPLVQLDHSPRLDEPTAIVLSVVTVALCLLFFKKKDLL